MPNVFASWVSALANLRSAGISSHKMKVNGDAAYYHLGVTEGASINIKSLQKPDAYLRPRSFGFELDIKVPSYQASLTEIEVLDGILIDQPVAIQLGTTDGLYFETTSLVGVQWKLICGGDMDDFRKIEYMYKGNIKRTELDALFTASATGNGTPDVSDTLYTLLTSPVASPVLANCVPNGLASVKFKAAADSTYDDFGDFRNGKYTFETIGENGGGGRGLPRTTAIKFTFDADLLQTSATELAMLDLLQSTEIDLKLTHMDGVTLLMNDTNFSILPEVSFEGNVDKIRLIKVHGEGSLVFNGTAFVDQAGTAWDALWAAS